MNSPFGKSFHGEFTSADASALSEANSRIALYDIDKNAITLAANERVVITHLFGIGGSALTVTVYDGENATPAAGERILLGNFGATGGVDTTFGGVPHHCKGNNSTATPLGYPKVKASGAGQIDVTIHGYIERY